LTELHIDQMCSNNFLKVFKDRDLLVPDPISVADEDKPLTHALRTVLNPTALNLLEDAQLWLDLGNMGLLDSSLATGRDQDEIYIHQVRARKIVDVLYDFVFIFFGDTDWVDCDRVLVWWTVLDLLDLSIANLKYHTLWLSGRCRKVLPKRTPSVLGKDGWLGSNELRRRLIQKLDKRSNKTKVLVETLLMGVKRGFPSMREAEVDKEMDKFIKEMSSPSATDKRKPRRFEYLEDEVRRTAAEVAQWRTLEPEIRPGYRFSNRAGLLAPIALGGVEGDLFRKRFIKYPVMVFSEEFIGFSTIAERFSQPKEVREWIYPYQELWSDAYNRFREVDPGYCWTVQLAPIYEPLKVRLITKGEPDLYSLLKPFQDVMWKSLGQFGVFRLTGEEVCFDTISATLSRLATEYPHWKKFCSGDYKGATNSINLKLTRAVYQTLFSLEHHLLLEKALGPQYIVKPGGCPHMARLSGEGGMQAIGQLMGSPPSFPVLCIINAAVGRAAYERATHRTFRLDELPMLVNGDDFAARMDDQIYAEWVKLVGTVGWELSPGKSFFSGEFVQINSTTYYVNEDLSDEGQFDVRFDYSPTPFVNFGYLHQMGKGVEQCNDYDPMTLDLDQRYAEEAMETLPEPFRSRSLEVLYRRLRLAGAALHAAGRAPRPLLLDVPPSLGGFGLYRKEGPLTYAEHLHCDFFSRYDLPRKVSSPVDFLPGPDQGTKFEQRELKLYREQLDRESKIYQRGPQRNYWKEIFPHKETVVGPRKIHEKNIMERHAWRTQRSGEAITLTNETS